MAATNIVLRVGQCNNCGECCLLFINGKYQRCQFYDEKAERHCTIWNKRPYECRIFPRTPMDISNKPHCSFKFLSETGRVLTDSQDSRVHLTHFAYVPPTKTRA